MSRIHLPGVGDVEVPPEPQSVTLDAGQLIALVAAPIHAANAVGNNIEDWEEARRFAAQEAVEVIAEALVLQGTGALPKAILAAAQRYRNAPPA